MFNWRQAKHFRAFAYSTQGIRENGNEDNYLLINNQDKKTTASYLKNEQPVSMELEQWDNQKIRIAVADGMGGHRHGREAAELLIAELIKISATEQVSQLAGHIKALHKNLLERLGGSGKNRPGSTLVVADIDCASGLCVLANVGDSRAYLLREGRLHQLSLDHIYCEFAWRDGDLTDDKYFTARHSPNADLCQAMGYGSHGIVRAADGSRPYQYNPNLRLDFKDDGQPWRYDWDQARPQHRDVFLLQLEADDVLLLASDGLWAMGEDGRWLPEITAPLTDAAALQKLAQAAVDAGGQDNATLVMCAKEGALGGYNALDGKTEQVYQGSKNIAETIRRRFIAPTLSKLKPIDFKSLKLSVFLCLLVAFWVLVVLRISELHSQDGVVAETGKTSEDQRLFEDLQQSPFMATDGQKRLLLMPGDYDLARKVKGVPLVGNEAELFKNLYASKAGDIVRAQILHWNQTREFSALRDSEPVNWQISNAYDLKLATGGIVPDAFGFIHQKYLNSGDGYVYGALRTEFNEWTVVRHDDVALYQREIPAGKRLNSQYVGRLINCQLELAGPSYKDCKNFIKPLCKIRGLISKSKGCDLNSATAGEIRFGGLATKATVKLQLEPVSNPANEVNDLAISYQCKKEDCGNIAKDRFVYQFKKALSKPLQEQKDSRFTIETADGVKLTNEFGLLDPKAEELGLIGLIGVDKNDYNRLSYLMANSGFPDGFRLKLTLDSRVQQAANAVLNKGIENLNSERSIDPYQPVRRAALIILDADNGDILAASSFPQPPRQVDWREKSWDKAAFANNYFQLDPFLNRGWQGGDNNQAPGSSFKIFMASAAAARIKELQGTPEGATLERYFNGLNKTDFTQLTGLTMAASKIPVYSQAYFDGRLNQFEQYNLGNFCNPENVCETMAYFYDKPLNAGQCGATNIVQDRLGVAEALRDSSNVWFVQLAKLMDGKTAEYHDLADPMGESKLFLKGFMSDFDFDNSVGLLPGIDKLNPKQQELWSASPIFATPKDNIPQLISARRGSLAIMNLVQTSIGQSLHVAPLQMAQVATLAATGNWFHPGLIKQWGDDKTQPRIANKLDGDLGLIQQGMAAVVQVGTAMKAFENHPDRCDTYGKTGTAQTEEPVTSLPKHTSAWFIGWREPKENGEKKLSFACMVTHILGDSSGGSVCGSIVAEFLRAVRQ